MPVFKQVHIPCYFCGKSLVSGRSYDFDHDGTVSASFKHAMPSERTLVYIGFRVRSLHKIILSPSYCPGTSIFDLSLPRLEKDPGEGSFSRLGRL